MREYIYKVVWTGFEEAFETYDEAYELASANLTKKPIIEEIEIERNDFGECIDAEEPITVWSYTDELDTDTDIDDPDFSTYTEEEESYHKKMLDEWEDDDEFDDPEFFDLELEEDTHAPKAQPEVDNKAAFNRALSTAKAYNKPVIYGYLGSDHHGGYRYYEIEQIVCDNNTIDSCIAEVMKKYKPAGSVLVAYPDRNFIKEALDDTAVVKQILSNYYVSETDPKNKLGKEYIRALGNDEKLPRGFKFLAGADTSGIVQYKGAKYYWNLVNSKIDVVHESLKSSSELDYGKLREELETFEDEVECQECFDIVPKTECVHKEGVGYICKNCAK